MINRGGKDTTPSGFQTFSDWGEMQRLIVCIVVLKDANEVVVVVVVVVYLRCRENREP